MKKKVMILILVLTQAAFIASGKTSFPQTYRLEKNLAKTTGYIKRFDARILRTKAALIKVKSVFEKGIELSEKVASVDDKLKETIRSLTVFTRIPKIKLFVRGVLHQAERMSKGIHSARVKLDKLKNKFLSPAAKKLQAQENHLAQIQGYFARINDKISFSVNMIQLARTTVEEKKHCRVRSGKWSRAAEKPTKQ
jgi:hypothetical protein